MPASDGTDKPCKKTDLYARSSFPFYHVFNKRTETAVIATKPPVTGIAELYILELSNRMKADKKFFIIL